MTLKNHLALALLAFSLALGPPAEAKKLGGRHSGAKSSSHSAHSPRAASGVKRDKYGRIARSSKAKGDFRKAHPCPSTGKKSGACPGYVIDHVKPLKRGGADHPSNMQWQTRRAAKDKDRTE